MDRNSFILFIDCPPWVHRPSFRSCGHVPVTWHVRWPCGAQGQRRGGWLLWKHQAHSGTCTWPNFFKGKKILTDFVQHWLLQDVIFVYDRRYIHENILQYKVILVLILICEQQSGFFSIQFHARNNVTFTKNVVQSCRCVMI